jgi:hypothetical protein
VIDPKANQSYQQQNTIKFVIGDTLWIRNVQFHIVSNADNLLTLKPVTAKIS